MERIDDRFDRMSKRQWVLLVGMGLFSLWESYVFFSGGQTRWHSILAHPLGRAFLLHVGNFNNAFGLALLVDLALGALTKKLPVRVVVAAIISTITFVAIELGDPLDIHAAIVGVIYYLCFRL